MNVFFMAAPPHMEVRWLKANFPSELHWASPALYLGREIPIIKQSSALLPFTLDLYAIIYLLFFILVRLHFSILINTHCSVLKSLWARLSFVQKVLREARPRPACKWVQPGEAKLFTIESFSSGWCKSTLRADWTVIRKKLPRYQRFSIMPWSIRFCD